MVKFNFVTVFVLVFSWTTFLFAQDVKFSGRIGGGLIIENIITEDRTSDFGGGAALDIMIKPFSISPFYERYKKYDDFTITYLGLNGLLMTKFGFYIGGGIGEGGTGFRDYWIVPLRKSLMVDFLLGIRKNTSKNMGIYSEGKFY